MYFGLAAALAAWYNKYRHIKALSDTERSKNNVGEKT